MLIFYYFRGMRRNIRVYSPFLFVFFCFFSCKREAAFNTKGSDQLAREARSYYEKGEVFTDRNRYDSAYFYYNLSKDRYHRAGDSLNEAYALLQMGEVSYFYADYATSEDAATGALPVFERAHHPEYTLAAYNLLGMVARKQRNFDDALRYYDNSLNGIKDSLNRGIILNNKASVLKETGRYAAAIKILTTLLQKRYIHAHPQTHARIYNTLGQVYQEQGNRQKALEAYSRSLTMREEQKDVPGRLSSYLSMAEFYEKPDPLKAADFAKRALPIARQTNSGDDKLRALRVLAGTVPNGYSRYFEQYLQVQDSIERKRTSAKNQFAKMRYDVRVVQEQREQDRLAYERSRANNRLYLIASLAAILVLALLIWIFRLRYRREKAQEVYNTERRLSQRIHDELANDVFRMISLAETLDLKGYEKGRLLEGLDEVYERTRDIARDNSAIDTGPGYSKSLKEMLSEFQAAGTNVFVVNTQEDLWDAVSEESKVTLYRVLQELMVNMRKHSNASRVMLSFTKIKRQLHVRYTDDGVGFSSEGKHKKNGVLNAGSRISSLGGRITFGQNGEKGLAVHIVLPL